MRCCALLAAIRAAAQGTAGMAARVWSVAWRCAAACQSCTSATPTTETGPTPAQICTGTGRTPAHICTGTGRTPAHICTGTALAPAHICPGTGAARVKKAAAADRAAERLTFRRTDLGRGCRGTSCPESSASCAHAALMPCHAAQGICRRRTERSRGYAWPGATRKARPAEAAEDGRRTARWQAESGP